MPLHEFLEIPVASLQADQSAQTAAETILRHTALRPPATSQTEGSPTRVRDPATSLLIESTDADARLMVFVNRPVGDMETHISPPPYQRLGRGQLDKQAKGRGIYAGITPESIAAREAGCEVGVFLSPPLPELRIRDVRYGNPNSPLTMVRGILRHARYLRQAQKTSDEAVATAIDKQHGTANAVLMNPAPRVHLRYLRRAGRFPPYASGWMLFRGDIVLERIGTAEAF